MGVVFGLEWRGSKSLVVSSIEENLAMKRAKTLSRVFLNAPLSHVAAQLLNEQIKALLEEEGFECIFPQEILPPGPEASPIEVFKQNTRFVKDCDVVLTVLDAPGEGVFFELGLAYALGKPIIIFRSDRQNYLGKVIEGLWQMMPDLRKATTLEKLRSVVRRLKETRDG